MAAPQPPQRETGKEEPARAVRRWTLVAQGQQRRGVQPGRRGGRRMTGASWIRSSLFYRYLRLGLKLLTEIGPGQIMGNERDAKVRCGGRAVSPPGVTGQAARKYRRTLAGRLELLAQ